MKNILKLSSAQTLLYNVTLLVEEDNISYVSVSNIEAVKMLANA